MYELPQMNGYSEHFVENDKCMNLLINDKEILKNLIKYGIKLKVYF